jgi:hypothetical protein
LSRCRRRAPRSAAARIEAAPYIVKELGERPAEPTKVRVWDQGAREIECCRERGIELDIGGPGF